ncbi:MAG: hypothetical protein IPJ65_20950 [Archangiaceae bacterium]|nr:hypothetical protein [Archangiaceae bacterium]
MARVNPTGLTGVAAALRRPTTTLRVEQLIERLVTAQGMKLGDQLFARVEPHFEGLELLEPNVPVPNPPTDPLARVMLEAYQNIFVSPFHARGELPGALAQMLVPFADAQRSGAVDLDKVERAGGPELREWVAQLGAIPDDAPLPQLADRRAWESVADHVRLELTRLAPSIAPPLESLDWTRTTFGRPGELKGFRLFGLQHLMATTAQLFNGLEKLGVEAKGSRVIGKIYSTNFRVAAELEGKGMVVDGVSRTIAAGESFNEEMDSAIEYQLTRLIDTLPQPTCTLGRDGKSELEWAEPPRPQVLLIDDGAEAIRILHQKFPEWAPFFACVEQTRRGARIAHELADRGELKCAVVNVAEAWAKLERESPMIAESVVREVERKLDRLERTGLPPPKEATVVGYGAVGAHVAATLRARGLTVHVYDQNPERMKNLPPGIIGHTDKHAALEHAGLLVSCVGERTLWPEDYDALPDGALLVNAASADDELGPQDLLKQQKRLVTLDRERDAWSVFRGQPICVGKPDAVAHSDAVIRLDSGKELLLVSNGYVVNMTGERDPIPPRYIQLTRSLLMMGALTATRATGPGLIDVPEDWQRGLVAHLEQSLAQSGESLENPLWDQVIEQAPKEPPPDVVAAAQLERRAARHRALAEPVAPDQPRHLPAQGREGVARQEPGKVYGFTLGKVRDLSSFAGKVALAMGIVDRTHTPESWALYHASQCINRSMHASLAVRFAPDDAERITPEQVLASPANARRAAGGRDATLFEGYFGLYLRSLAVQALAKQNGSAPEPAQVAEAMRQAASLGQVDLGAYVDLLRASDDFHERELARALVK